MSYLSTFLSAQETPTSATPASVSMTQTQTNADGSTEEVNRSASAVRADLTRAEWADYQNSYQPFEQLANDAVLDPTRRRELFDQGNALATEAVNQSYDRAQGSNDLTRSRFGMSTDSRTARSEQLQNSVNRSADLVGSRNSTSDYMRDREMTLLAG